MSARLPYNYKPSDGLLSTVWQVEICYPDKAPDPYETFAAFKDLAGWMERHNIEQAMLEVSVSDREYIDGKYRHMIKWKGEEQHPEGAGMTIEAWTTISTDDSGNLVFDNALETSFATRGRVRPPLKGKDDIIGIPNFYKRIPDEAAATAFMEEALWDGIPYCGRCGTMNVYQVKSGKPLSHRCRACKRYFSVRTGTALAESNLSIHTWLLATYFIFTGRKGVSSIQLAKQLGISQTAAWFLGHRIRGAMRWTGGKLKGTIQVDEAYFGGKFKWMHSKNKPRKEDGTVDPFANKFLVMALTDEEGNTIAFPMMKADGDTMKQYILDNVEKGSTIYTDSHIGYQGLDKLGYIHKWVNHSAGEYVSEDGRVTTNRTESFWSVLKHGYVGTFQYMSPEHLYRYANEFSHRNTMGHGNGFETLARVLRRLVNQRLTWEELVAHNHDLMLSNAPWEGIEAEIMEALTSPSYGEELC